VIALREDLRAAAHALELTADLLYPVGLLLSEKRQDGESSDQEQRSE
jgi:hypothetical protein